MDVTSTIIKFVIAAAVIGLIISAFSVARVLYVDAKRERQKNRGKVAARKDYGASKKQSVFAPLEMEDDFEEDTIMPERPYPNEETREPERQPLHSALTHDSSDGGCDSGSSSSSSSSSSCGGGDGGGD